MDVDEFAVRLMSAERRKWQDPGPILKGAGIKKGMSVADLGCGPGFFTIPIASLVGETGVVYAVDVQPMMLEYLRKNLSSLGSEMKTVKVIQADASNTTIPARSVDLVLFANILHDIDDKKAFLGEVKRISRKGATAVDVDWKKAPSEAGPPFELRLSEQEARKILLENGFTDIGRVDAGPHHYGLVCEVNA